MSGMVPTRTDEGQPQKLQAHNGQDGQQDPQQRLDVQRQPEEPAIGGVDDLCPGLARLKDPFGVARLRVDLVPPPQTDEPPPRDVLEVVEVCGEEQDGDDEDHDPESVSCVSCVCCAGRAGGHTYMLAVTQSPKKYTKTLATWC